MAKKQPTRLPYMAFFTADWIRDTRVLSLEARAVWLDMICLMHDGDNRGVLSRAGIALSMEQLARCCGCSVPTVESAVAEILKAGVASKDDEGFIVSRRILRDEKRRQTNRRNGRHGGNPSLLISDNPSDNPSVNPPDNPPDNPPVITSDNPTNGYGIRNGDGNDSSGLGGGAGEGNLDLFGVAWLAWQKHRREIGHTLTPSTRTRQLAKLRKMGPERAIAAIEHSIENGWIGIFEPKVSHANSRGNTGNRADRFNYREST